MIWLTGNRGMLGSEVEALLRAEGAELVTSGREVDIASYAAVREFCELYRPSWIVNCAAYAAVDQAEDDEERAHQVNALGPGNLGRAALSAGARVLHVSTDYVFDGTSTTPYTEEAKVKPLGAYGRTKAEGELLLAQSGASYLIVRTAWLYGPNGPNFVSTMLRLMDERERLNVVTDERGSPTYAGDLADALGAVMESHRAKDGIYHCTNDGEASRFEFATAILEEGRARGLIAGNPVIHGIGSGEYPTRAERPGYSVLSTDKVSTLLNRRMPHWRAGLSRYCDRIAQGERREEWRAESR